MSLLAATPTGSTPASVPASTPTFCGLWTQTPIRSRSGLSMAARSAADPALPVLHWMTR